MKELQESRRRILDLLLDRPDGATAGELAAHLGMTKAATKEHILKLEGLGYLTHEDERGAVGRPKRRYRLSADGHEAFPRQYSWLSNALLEHLAAGLGASGVARLMNGLAADVAASMAARFKNAATPAALLAELTAAMNELGYRAQLRQSDLRKGGVIEATNCVYHSVAKQHPELCQFDVKFMEKATGMKVTLECCIARGAAVCRFGLRKREGGSQP